MNKLNKLTSDAVKKTYHFYAPIYDLIFGACLEPGRKALSVEVHAIQPNTLLEIGVGTGLLLSQYPQKTNITGIDISDDMLQIARKKANLLTHMTIKLETMNAEELSYPDNHFECVVLPYVLSVTPNPEKLVAEARRVCKKDGSILIVNHFSGNKFWSLLEKPLQNLANRIGFRSEFSYNTYISNNDWTILKVQSVNMFSLSKLITIKNTK